MTAPVEKGTEDEAAVTKSITELAEGETAETVAAGLDAVAKAKGDPQVIVYNAAGKAIGIVDPDKLQPIASDDGAKPDDAPAGDTAPASDAPAEPAPAEPAAAPEPGAPAAPETIPGTDTVQEPAEPDTTDDNTVAKSTAELVKAAVAESTAELSAELRLVKEQLAAYGAQPAPGGPRLNGATGTAGLAPRSTEPDEVEQLRKAAETETDPKKREELSYSAALAAIRKAQTGHGPYIGQAPVNAADVLARFTS